jgi:hypothetical protein
MPLIPLAGPEKAVGEGVRELMHRIAQNMRWDARRGQQWDEKETRPEQLQTQLPTQSAVAQQRGVRRDRTRDNQTIPVLPTDF